MNGVLLSVAIVLLPAVEPAATAKAKPATVLKPTAKASPTVAATPGGMPIKTAATIEATEGSTESPSRPSAAVERPTWLKEPTGVRNGQYVMHVNAGPAFSRTDCEPKLRAAVEQRLRAYVGEVVPGGAAGAVPLDLDRLWPRIVTDEWEERVERENATIVFLHANVRIDDKLRTQWKTEATEYVQTVRGREVMFGYGLAIAAAAATFLLLKCVGPRSDGLRAGVLPSVSLATIIAVGTVIWLLMLIA